MSLPRDPPSHSERSPTADVVLDTNVFVAAGFNRRSASARILEAVRHGDLRLVWDEPTRAETRAVLTRIPPLSWNPVENLFSEEARFDGETCPELWVRIPDPADRKFAALAEAAGAVLVTNDDHLLAGREDLALEILTPSEFAGRL